MSAPTRKRVQLQDLVGTILSPSDEEAAPMGLVSCARASLALQLPRPDARDPEAARAFSGASRGPGLLSVDYLGIVILDQVLRPVLAKWRL
jgi:hypothetical protein